MNMPLWLTKHLKEKKFVEVSFPKVYTLSYRQALTADATVINLFDWNPFYFDFGMAFVKLVAAELLAHVFIVDAPVMVRLFFGRLGVGKIQIIKELV